MIFLKKWYFNGNFLVSIFLFIRYSQINSYKKVYYVSIIIRWFGGSFAVVFLMFSFTIHWSF